MFCVEKPDFAAQLNDEEWCVKVDKFVDVFRYLNHLNKNVQEKQEHMLTSSDKVIGFFKKKLEYENYM